MDFFYLIGLQQVETGMRKQFEYAEEPRPERPDARPERPTRTTRTRLAIGAALYRLAEAIEPATPVPSRQH
jgi:hypothetical protein